MPEPSAIIARRNAIIVLAHLARVHPKPVSMTAFTRAAGIVADRARHLRDDLESIGLLRVTIRGLRGPVKALDIGLTAKGLRVARKAHELLQEADP